jgi:hypothetical protein
VTTLAVGDHFEDLTAGVRVQVMSIACPGQSTATVELNYCPDTWASLETCNPRVYTGEDVAVTRCGVPCQNWALDVPHNHTFNNVGNHSFCRNPNNRGSAWCYTNDANTLWDYCDVCGGTTNCSFPDPPTVPPPPMCDLCLGKDVVANGANYNGTVSTTVGGRTCQVWSLDTPQSHNFNYVGTHNYCRNPDNDPAGTWCYTTDPNVRWEYCGQDIVCPQIPGNDAVSWSEAAFQADSVFARQACGTSGPRRGARPLPLTACAAP